MVVLPGGGYTDIWLDKEGHNIALFFKEYGITSLVVKYRTNTPDKDGKKTLSRKDYLPAAVADAKEGIRILRSRAEELNIEPDSIGVGGFSAGGHLSLSVCFSPDENNKESYPDFAFLIYPWIEDYFEKKVNKTKNLPPMFIVNGQEDTVTPPDVCAQFYYTLCKNNVPAELHIYRKGTHGFGLSFGTGNSTTQWKQSFIEWLKDMDMIKGR
jgi:acetyl esterase/lipase